MAQSKEELNRKARERMAARRKTPEYQAWLEESRERRKELKTKYRRAAGARPIEQVASDAAERRRQEQADKAERCVARSQPDGHVLAWMQHRKQMRRTSTGKESRVTVDRLRELLAYEPDTGVLRWRVGYGKAFAGSPAGARTWAGYMAVGIDGEKFRVHRVAWALVRGAWPEKTIDHMDGDRCNNRLINLREVSQAVNNQNRRKPTARNTSGYLGVHRSGKHGGWMATLTISGKKKRRGPYKTPERAFDAYVDLKRRHHEGCTL